MIPAVKRSMTLLAVAMLIAGCGGQASHAAASPSSKANGSPATSPVSAGSPSAAASPVPLTAAFAVLATSTSADNYNVSIVGADGKVVGSAQPSSPTAVTCGSAGPAVVPLPISTSNDRAYYMDAQGVVRFMTAQGETGRATTVPTGSGRRSMFAVSPDDQRIAVIVSDYTASGVSLKLYVEDLNGATNHVDIFSSIGAYGLWPIGWHGTDNLVVAKVPACAQGAGFGCCGPLELHVVDPATATRRFTLGGADCLIAGPPTPGGVLCESAAIDYKVYDWVNNLLKQEPSGLTVRRPAYLSPNGQHIAQTDGTTTQLAYEVGSLPMDVCGWIDDTHIISGGDAQHQPRVGNITTHAVVPVASLGTCAGRLPGGL
jgi:hypothetical protein